ncbi:hypothetical protein ACFY4C_20435 [Actinomadura viridis]|uniref:hypothetical protein n=1 Tax=Actinomadura viridis TaxID=58110 RepID=UPI0036CF71AA
MSWLRLVKPFDGGAAPDYPEHDGRPVTWRPWQAPLQVSRVQLSCSVCGTSDVWATAGVVGPLPGDQFTVVERASIMDGSVYGIERETQSWPVSQLFAFRCSSCGDTSVFDTGRSGAEWVEIDLDRRVIW